jgi:hypothetical protein
LTFLNLFLVLGTFAGSAIGIRQAKISRTSADAARSAATAATDALTVAKGNLEEMKRNDTEQSEFAKEAFRQDQRPYLAIAPVDLVKSDLKIAPSGIHRGQIHFTFQIQNYGKSPAYAYGIDGRIAVDNDSLHGLPLHSANDKYPQVIPPGDRPYISAYSEKLTDDQIKKWAVGTLRMVVYGHVDYTDIFPAPKPAYQLYFCARLLGDPSWPDAISRCTNLNYIK